jgi:hypothetical protein
MGKGEMYLGFRFKISLHSPNWKMKEGHNQTVSDREMEEYGATVKEWSFTQDKERQSRFLNESKMTHKKAATKLHAVWFQHDFSVFQSSFHIHIKMKRRSYIVSCYECFFGMKLREILTHIFSAFSWGFI